MELTNIKVQSCFIKPRNGRWRDSDPPLIIRPYTLDRHQGKRIRLSPATAWPEEGSIEINLELENAKRFYIANAISEGMSLAGVKAVGENVVPRPAWWIRCGLTRELLTQEVSLGNHKVARHILWGIGPDPAWINPHSHNVCVRFIDGSIVVLPEFSSIEELDNYEGSLTLVFRSSSLSLLAFKTLPKVDERASIFQDPSADEAGQQIIVAPDLLASLDALDEEDQFESESEEFADAALTAEGKVAETEDMTTATKDERQTLDSEVAVTTPTAKPLKLRPELQKLVGCGLRVELAEKIQRAKIKDLEKLVTAKRPPGKIDKGEQDEIKDALDIATKL